MTTGNARQVAYTDLGQEPIVTTIGQLRKRYGAQATASLMRHGSFVAKSGRVYRVLVERYTPMAEWIK